MARATRITRSTSREPTSESLRTSGRQKKQRSATAKGQTSMPAIAEKATSSEVGHDDDDDHSANLDDDENKENQIDSDADQEAQSSPRTSAVARTSFSQEELDNLDPETLLREFTALDGYATRVIDIAAPKEKRLKDYLDIVADLASRSTAKNRLAQYVNIFHSVRSFFGTQAFLRPDLILRAITGKPSLAFTSAPWTPHDLVFKSNLASLVSVLDQVASDDEQATTDSAAATLASLDREFPLYFMQSLVSRENAAKVVGESTLCKETRRVAIALRTQVAVFRLLARQPDQDLENILALVFLDIDDPDDLIPNIRISKDPAIYRTWLGDSFVDAADGFARDQLKRVKAMIDILETSDGNNLDDFVANVAKKYPFDAFRAEMHHWISLRHSEIVDSVEQRGGRDAVFRQLRLQYELSTNPTQESRQVVPAAPRRSAISILKNMTKTSTSQASANPTSTPVLQPTPEKGPVRQPSAAPDLASRAQSDVPTPSSKKRRQPAPPTMPAASDELFVHDGPDTDESSHPKDPHLTEARRRVEEKKQLQMQKQRRFVDRQSDAAKVTWAEDSDHPRSAPPQPRPTAPPASASPDSPEKRRRTGRDSSVAVGRREVHGQDVQVISDGEAQPNSGATDENFDPTQDDGFEQDKREHASGRRPARPSDEHEGHAIPGTGTGNLESPPADRVTQRAQRVIPDEEDTEQMLQLVHDSSTRARTQTTGRRVGQDGRIPFSAEEDAVLIRMIGEHGPQFATIYAADRESGADVFSARKNSTALRDRARQLKVNLLIARQPLPRNFDDDCIKLSIAQVEKVNDAGGRSYYRPGR